MSLDQDTIEANATDGSPFSNGTTGYDWMGRWCDVCKIDGPFQRGVADLGCPIVLVAMLGKTPAEWVETGVQDYCCTEFIPDDHGGDDGDPEPHPLFPPPVVEGQVDMFEVFAEQITENVSRQEQVAV